MRQQLACVHVLAIDPKVSRAGEASKNPSEGKWRWRRQVGQQYPPYACLQDSTTRREEEGIGYIFLCPVAEADGHNRVNSQTEMITSVSATYG
jgi:hypothetical protein